MITIRIEVLATAPIVLQATCRAGSHLGEVVRSSGHPDHVFGWIREHVLEHAGSVSRIFEDLAPASLLVERKSDRAEGEP